MKSVLPLLRSLASLSLLVLVLLIQGGCATGGDPTPAKRQAAIDEGLATLGEQWPAMTASIYFVVSSDTPFTLHVTPVEGEPNRYLTEGFPADYVQGMACALTPDGYLLTDMHILREHVWVYGLFDDKMTFRPARVVQQQAEGDYGAEVAVLHVAGAPTVGRDLVPLPSQLDRIVSVGWTLTDGFFDIVPLAGHLTSPLRDPDTTTTQVLRHNIPCRRGDSGGPLFTPRGELIGVNNGWIKPGLFAPVTGLSYAPDLALIQSWIKADRDRSSASPAP